MPTGRQAEGDIEPALPNEQASPGAVFEMKVMRWPPRYSQAPTQVPTMPVPLIAWCMSAWNRVGCHSPMGGGKCCTGKA